MNKRPRLLWVDSLGGLGVGAGVLILSTWLSELQGLPWQVLVFMGVANLVYGSYSLSLVLRARRTTPQIALLAGANMAWLLVCIAIAWIYHDVMTIFGDLHVIGEGIYVAGLGAVEWRRRATLERYGE